MALSDEEAGLSPKSVKSKPPKAPKEDADDEEAFGDLSSDDVDLPSGDDSDDEGLGGNHSYSDLQESDFDDEDEAYGGAIIDSDEGEGDQGSSRFSTSSTATDPLLQLPRRSLQLTPFSGTLTISPTFFRTRARTTSTQCRSVLF